MGVIVKKVFTIVSFVLFVIVFSRPGFASTGHYECPLGQSVMPGEENCEYPYCATEDCHQDTKGTICTLVCYGLATWVCDDGGHNCEEPAQC